MMITTESISAAAEKWFGIKADPGDLEKMRLWLLESCGEGGPDGACETGSEILEKAFLSGKAAAFLTVNETYFFREPVHFSFLWELLPSFGNTTLQICSAAVASGCEAYSIAMMIEAYNKDAGKPIAYHIDAFDINPMVIETAKKGIYSLRTLREDGSVLHHMTEPYLLKSDSALHIDMELAKNISFFVHNLMHELPSKDYDLIFFRNAFIYFTPQNRGKVLSNLSCSLKEGGILIMGVSETAQAGHTDFSAKNKNDVFYFQKT
ncbi:MAG: hypothetical protein FWG77_08030 [Treponema sp.]|nr:hypothetical protein [Treponema sp.]